ncbi:HNH endonuclease signature motif containing protein [[Mycobacterium] vasticus]|uniref:DUF222 domain-containing protein n=1 Tax=[Mycobacterium] vasticus TaxID=2875777 RepID=A0ABU5YVM8_9MYCO|nr:DUF222 domain-containing protein [Mycolicibacter sp. MYC017]MEB3068941.1 DUF222 domain-containing protein [Mycolicibacter sp. MYC017]
MFDSQLPEPADLADVDDAALVEAIGGWARVEAAAAARRLAAIGELVARRTRGVDAVNRSRWTCDYWDLAASEVAATERISHGMASSQMYLASALRDRLPRVAAMFLHGQISTRLVATIVWHTTLITDPYLLHAVEVDLIAVATGLGKLSATKAAAAIDALIDRHDPQAIRRHHHSARGRDVVIDTRNAENGTTGVWGRLLDADATALAQRLTQMTHTVCDDDPRTLAQRRADALGALAAGADTLTCTCTNSNCPSSAGSDARSTSVTVYVVADQAALDATAAPHSDPEPPGKQRHARPAPSGRIIGGGSIPGPLLSQLIRRGATVKPLHHPGDAPAQPRYRPSTALAAFIRARDMTCRFPGCDRPATACDIDHAIAYPAGPTHPANLRCLCRKHHLLKTFWTGDTGWHNTQNPDGTIEWTSPTGHTYTTTPGSTLLFPSLCLPTGASPPPRTPLAPGTCRSVMMPTRTRTRAQNRSAQIEAERALNAPP